jgi:hypothetical protein
MVGRRAWFADCANRRGVPAYREGERDERGEVTLNEAAAILQVSAMTVLRMIWSGTLPARARRLCKGAPCVINAVDLGADVA